MAAAKKDIPGKFIIDILEEYNVSKVDIIIYSVCIGVLVLSVVLFIFFSRDLVSKQERYVELQDTLLEYEVLKKKQGEITRDYENLNELSLDLRNKFFLEKQLNEFKEGVKKLAKEYKCANDKIGATERSEEKFTEVNYFVNVNGRKVKKTIKLKKKIIVFDFQMTLGSFVGFVKSLERTNKIVEILPFRISQGDTDDFIRLTSFQTAVYTVPSTLDEELKALLEDITMDDYIVPVRLGERAQVIPVREKKVLKKEIVKTSYGEWEVKPIFRTVKPPPPRPIMPPEGLAYMMSIGPNSAVFTFNGDTSAPYYAEVGQVVKTKAGKLVPKYETMKLKEVQKFGFIFEFEDITGELSKLKR